MPQLLVRDIEAAVVKRLRNVAAEQGISVEEAHRRVLRSALLGPAADRQNSFIDYLRSIPPNETVEFPRSKDLPRKAAF